MRRSGETGGLLLPASSHSAPDGTPSSSTLDVPLVEPPSECCEEAPSLDQHANTPTPVAAAQGSRPGGPR